jgi:hypothetical protein
MNGYSIFLMIELARAYNIIDKELEYDLTWEKGEQLYQELLASAHNDNHLGEYECIENFLKSDVPTLADKERAEAIFNGLPEDSKVLELLHDKLAERFAK